MVIGEGKNIEFAPPTAGFQHGESATSILIIWSEIAAHSTSLRVNFCARNDIFLWIWSFRRKDNSREIASAPCFLAKAKRGPRNDFLIDSSAPPFDYAQDFQAVSQL